MTRIVLMEDYLDCARKLSCVQALSRQADLMIYTDKAASQQELERRLAGADIAITIRDRLVFSPALLTKLTHLRLLSVCGPRVEPHINIEAATRAGIAICAVPKTDTPWSTHHATAELTWGLILALMKDLVANERVMRAGGWQTRLGRGLQGKTLGIIGLGRIGALVARIAHCMQMRVIAWGPRLTTGEAEPGVAEYVSFNDVFTDSDIVSLHANLTADSQRLIGDEQFELMKPSSLLINTARAGLVDEQALRRALDKGAIAGAGLDVYWEEPLPLGHWLRSHPSVLIQPHVGGFSEEGYRDLIEPAVDNVLAYLGGEPKNIINIGALDAESENP